MIRLLVANFWWKLLALAIAVGLWFVVVGGPRLVTFVPAPLEFRNHPTDLEISSDLPEFVRLEVEGPPSQLGGATLSGTAVVLDLSSVNAAGVRSFTINPRNVSLPVGVKLLRAVPAQLRIQFESRLSRDVPVRIRYSGPAPEGYRIRRDEVDPPKLTVIGPASHVNRIAFVETDPVDLSKVIGQQEFRVHTFAGDPHVRFETGSQVTVRVSMERVPANDL
jgi:hypothetical protein